MDRINLSVTAPVIMKTYGWNEASLGIIVSMTGRWEPIFYIGSALLVFGVRIWALFATGRQILE